MDCAYRWLELRHDLDRAGGRGRERYRMGISTRRPVEKKTFAFLAGEPNTEDEYRASAEENEHLNNWNDKQDEETRNKLKAFKELIATTRLVYFKNLRHFSERLEKTLRTAIPDPASLPTDLMLAARPSIEPAPSQPAPRRSQPSLGPEAGNEPLDTVRLGASAPRQCSPGQRFTAALVAYIDAARASAREKLEALGEPDDRVVMDVAPQRNASWQLGAPVAVRLTGEGVEVTPGEVRFEWNGHENLAAFAARVRDDAPAAVSLCFEVFLADVPIAFIPMRLNVAAQTAPLAAQQAQARVPGSVFASYSSKDAQPVTQRLSTLQRWSPRLDIFQDCLDLQPNTSFQPQIKAQIAQRDVFLLFWSRNAAASPWVQWEYQTARDTRGLNAILPMPLEDPAIAPPPPELADRHLRDRFMLAGYGLAKIRDEATGPPPV